MDCGDLPDGRCSEVLRDVWLFLDDEMDEENRAAVQRHLDDCSPCLEEAGLDAKLKSLLHSKCGGDRAPEHLRERLFAQLSQTRLTAGSHSLRVETTQVTVTEF